MFFALNLMMKECPVYGGDKRAESKSKVDVYSFMQWIQQFMHLTVTKFQSSVYTWKSKQTVVVGFNRLY